jgi:flavin-dependent dehydrogenase
VIEQLGLASAFDAMAGPQVRRVGLFTARSRFESRMPPLGRAIRRDEFDALLLERCAHYGARVYQPFNAGSTEEIPARIVIAAHGSWLPGRLATQPRHAAPRDSDLLGFKAVFRNCALAPDLMPLISFPGGYGGLVTCRDGCVTLSFCVRRDVLKRCRTRFPGLSAGDALLSHIVALSEPLRATLRQAARDGPWLAAGPVRPGARALHLGNSFLVGNAAGEAHPAIAEGIGMAMQSAALLCRRLLSQPRLAHAAVEYEAAWRSEFRLRLSASCLVAQAAMRPWAMRPVEGALRVAPRLLSFCAAVTGKGSCKTPGR